MAMMYLLYWLYIYSSGETGHNEISTFKLNLTLKVNSITPQNNRDLNQCVLHLWSKFGDPSLNGWWVIVQTNFMLKTG